MVERIAVVDPLPMFRQGITAVLSAAGYPIDSPDDVLAWAQRDRAGLVLFTLGTQEDSDLLGQLRTSTPYHVVIALLADESPWTGARALRAGARSVMPRRVGATELLRTVAATIAGQAVMPATVAAALVAGLPNPVTPTPAISREQLSWLRRLATGATVAELATTVGYSERAMFRLLKLLYREMGITSRVEAILRAQENGWFNSAEPEPGTRA